MYAVIAILEDLSILGLVILGCVWVEWKLIVFPILAYIILPCFNELLYNFSVAISFNSHDYKNSARQYYESLLNNRNHDSLPIFYHADYNLTACGLEKLHPFDSTKYKRIYDILNENELFRGKQFLHPKERVSRGTMLDLGMSKWYLFCLNYSAMISRCVELPLFFLPASVLRSRVLNPMLLATQGSIDAAVVALNKGWAINLSGGYHHACKRNGGGFCVYPDISLAIDHVRKYFSIGKAMIIDLDAHQGNGHGWDYLDDSANTFILDFYNHGIYPGDRQAKSSISLSLDVNSRTSDSTYLRSLQENTTKSLDNFKPEFVLYNAGTDCLQGDPLGNMNLSDEAVIKRDEIVFKECLKRGIPVMMVLSGGYQKKNAPVIAHSIINLFQTLNMLNHHHSSSYIDRI